MTDQDSGTPPDSAPGQPVRLRQVLAESVADGTYSNIVSVASSAAEFFLDFGRVVPGRPDVKVHARIIMAPAHAKRLAQALTEQVRRHEAAHGTIAGLPETPAPPTGVH